MKDTHKEILGETVKAFIENPDTTTDLARLISDKDFDDRMQKNRKRSRSRR